MVIKVVKKFSPFIQPEGPLPCSQGLGWVNVLGTGLKLAQPVAPTV
jgi:hypothetical protein